jgi:hypothetical protein
VDFFGVTRRAKPWVQRRPTRQCSICQRWGHSQHSCNSKVAYCALCGESHDTSLHASIHPRASTAPAIKCINCGSPHSALSRDCAFYRLRYNHREMDTLLRNKVQRTERQKAKSKGRAAPLL